MKVQAIDTLIMHNILSLTQNLCTYDFYKISGVL